MSWNDPSNGTWSFTEDRIVGAGPGFGSHGVAYALNEGGSCLNGIVAADFIVPRTEIGFAGGLICRANCERTFVAGYLVRNPAKSISALVLGACRLGTFVPRHGVVLPDQLTPGRHHLTLRFFSGNLRLTVQSEQQECVVEHVVADVPFPGAAGVVRLYNMDVELQNFSCAAIQDPFAEVKRPMYKYDAFICHSSKDKPTIASITSEFRKNGVTYWLDAEKIGFGQSVTKEIEEGLRNSKHVLVCLSCNLGKSNWCRGEYTSVLHQYFSGNTNRRVIPLKLDAVADTDIPALLYDIRRADFSNTKEFIELLAYLKS